jgi:hypothetical protein
MEDKPECLGTLDSLSDTEYAIIGDGQYVVDLMNQIVNEGHTKPTNIFVRTPNVDLPKGIQRPEEEISKLKSGKLLIGSNAFQVEIMQRVDKYNLAELPYLNPLGIDKSIEHPANYNFNDDVVSGPYVLFISINPIKHHDSFVLNFFKKLASRNIAVIVKHPFQYIQDELLFDALGVIVWNGAMAVHQVFIQQCERLKVNITYGECGFFPQSEFFYFDKNGVNDQSQLKVDNLSWLKDDCMQKLEVVREQFFKGTGVYPKTDYIFVPLQVPNDSNILTNSRFTSGMQEFIDYIEDRYIGENIIFKAHPKDRMKSSYCLKRGDFSVEDSRSLIMSSKLVHGINSSVLYEAALGRKTIVAEGNCLLNTFSGSVDAMLAAIVARQHSVNDSSFDAETLHRFSYFKEPLIEALAN